MPSAVGGVPNPLRVDGGVFGTYVSIGTNPASTGALRLPIDSGIYARDQANSANINLIRIQDSGSTDDIVVGDGVNPFSVNLQCKSGGYVGLSPAGTAQLKAQTDGVIVGNPTGGFKGNGTINAAGDIYKNNGAYTNPDYAFEHYYKGKIEKFADRDGAKSYRGLMPLAHVESYAERHLRLPRVSRDPMGMFERGDVLLEKVEELFLYLFQINRQLKAAGMAGV